MIRFVLVFTPSVPPLWYGRVTAACTASLSRSRPRVKAYRWAGRSRGRRQSIPQGVRGCPGAGSRPLTSFQGSQHHLRPQGRADQGWLAEQERRDHGLPGTRARAENAAFPLVPSSKDIRRAIFQTLSGSDPYEVVDGNGEALAISSLDARVRYTRTKPGHVQWSRSERRSETREIHWSLAM